MFIISLDQLTNNLSGDLICHSIVPLPVYYCRWDLYCLPFMISVLTGRCMIHKSSWTFIIWLTGQTNGRLSMKSFKIVHTFRWQGFIKRCIWYLWSFLQTACLFVWFYEKKFDVEINYALFIVW